MSATTGLGNRGLGVFWSGCGEGVRSQDRERAKRGTGEMKGRERNGPEREHHTPTKMPKPLAHRTTEQYTPHDQSGHVGQTVSVDTCLQFYSLSGYSGTLET